jgi:hypothetical protein
MSAGAFTKVVYETNAGLFTSIKVQPETLQLTLNAIVNIEATGTKTVGIPSAKVSGSKRSIGINARTVSVAFSGAAPTGYKTGSIIRLPVPSPIAWAAYDELQTGTYLGSPVRFAGKSEESVK